MNYIETLIENCKKAQEAKPSEDFELENMSQLNGIPQGIYIIEETNGDKEQTFCDFKNFKILKTHACPKVNSPSQILYVGSSTTGLKKRILQHTNEAPKQTYALNLWQWFKGTYKIRIKVYNEPVEVVQIIEDALSDQLSPAFGKRGGNNK